MYFLNFTHFGRFSQSVSSYGLGELFFLAVRFQKRPKCLFFEFYPLRPFVPVRKFFLRTGITFFLAVRFQKRPKCLLFEFYAFRPLLASVFTVRFQKQPKWVKIKKYPFRPLLASVLTVFLKRTKCYMYLMSNPQANGVDQIESTQSLVLFNQPLPVPPES